MTNDLNLSDIGKCQNTIVTFFVWRKNNRKIEPYTD